LERLSKRIQLTFESHFCEYDVRDFSVTFRFCSFLANFSRIWFCISSRLVLPIIHYNTLPDEKYFGGIPENEIEPAVKRMIKLEKLWFAITIRSIQTEYKQKEIDVEIENLRKELR
jgi:hypothetical protein